MTAINLCINMPKLRRKKSRDQGSEFTLGTNDTLVSVSEGGVLNGDGNDDLSSISSHPSTVSSRCSTIDEIISWEIPLFQ